MLKNLLFIIITLGVNLNVYATSIRAYTAANIEKIVIVLGTVVLIFSPSKFRIVLIGTLLGLTLAYLTYKYIVPIFVSYLANSIIFFILLFIRFTIIISLYQAILNMMLFLFSNLIIFFKFYKNLF